MLDPRFITALLCLLTTVVLFVWDWRDPANSPRIPSLNISAGWIGVVFTLYKFAQWWNRRSYARAQRAVVEAQRQRAAERAAERAEHHPEFDFNGGRERDNEPHGLP
jgi:hypothetical protein